MNLELNNKYKKMVFNDFQNYVRGIFYVIPVIEKKLRDDPIVRLIKNKEAVNIEKTKTFLIALFDVTKGEKYLLTIDKIKEQLESIVKNYTIDQSKKIPNFDFGQVINDLIADTEKFINSTIKCDYSFSYVKYNSIKKEKSYDEVLKENQKKSASSQLPILLKITKHLIKYLDNFKYLMETFSLSELQCADFKNDQYIALKDCFKKSDFTKKTMVDNEKILTIVEDLKNVNYLDVLSDSYGQYITTVLEACNYVFNYFIELDSDLENNISITCKENSTADVLTSQIEYFLDYIDGIYNYNYLTNYFEIHKTFVEFDFEKYKDAMIKRYFN